MEPQFSLSEDGRTLAVSGDWTVWTIAKTQRALQEAGAAPAILDVSNLGRLDTAGALILLSLYKAPPELRGEHANARELLTVTRESAERGGLLAHQPQLTPAPVPFLEQIGRWTAKLGTDAAQTLSFFGETLATVAAAARRPKDVRLISVASLMERAGLNAAPIVATLAFFIGLVVAYLGASVLADFGAQVFTVELVGFSVLREFAVLITAILLAGRTDSAFTAEIGAMKMRQEIDAMRVLGLDVMKRLVLPRVIAMTIMTPVLTFIAMMAGLLGGALACWATIGVSPVLFLSRIQEGVGETHFWVGMSKSPVFGFVLAVVGCRHGLLVGGDVASLGERTTASVVQAIFLVIVLDAIFALWFLEMNW